MPPEYESATGIWLTVPDANADGWSEAVNVVTRYDLTQGVPSTALVLLSGRDGQLLASSPVAAGLFPKSNAIVSVADMTGDGYLELLLGCDSLTDPTYPGVVLLRDGKSLVQLLDTTGPGSGVQFGAALSVGPDLTADGIAEVFVADPGATNSLGKLGVVRALDVAAWSLLSSPVFENAPSPYPLADNLYGTALLYLGNADSDAGGELAIGDPGYGVLLDGRIEIRDISSGAIQSEVFSTEYYGHLGDSLNRYRDVDGDGVVDIAAWQHVGFAANLNRFVLISSGAGMQIGSIEPIDSNTEFGKLLVDIGMGGADAGADYVASVGSATIECIFGNSPKPLVWISGEQDSITYEHKTLCSSEYNYSAGGAAVGPLSTDEQRLLVLGKASKPCTLTPWCWSWVALRLDEPVSYEPASLAGACHGLDMSWSGWLPSFQGHQTNLTLDGATPFQLNFLLLSLDASQWVGVAMPLDLGNFGAPGCSLLVPPDVLVPKLADGGGHAEAGLALSKDEPTLYGVSAYAQWVGYTPLNPLSLATSDALELILLP